MTFPGKWTTKGKNISPFNFIRVSRVPFFYLIPYFSISKCFIDISRLLSCSFTIFMCSIMYRKSFLGPLLLTNNLDFCLPFKRFCDGPLRVCENQVCLRCYDWHRFACSSQFSKSGQANLKANWVCKFKKTTFFQIGFFLCNVKAFLTVV